MHLAPVLIFVNCDRCRSRMTVSAQQHPREFVCQDCRDQEYIERKRIRSSYDPGDYHMTFDPDGSWSPTGKTYLNRKDIEVYIRCGTIIPGTRFECRGKVYSVTIDYKLIRTQ